VTSADELNITETGVKVTGAFTATGAAALNGGLTMDTDKFAVADATGDTLIKGTLGAGGGDGTGLAVDGDGDVTVGNDLAVTRDAAVTRNATVGGTLEVTGTSTLTGNVTGGGTVKSTGDFTVGDSKVVVTASSGNVVGKGSLQVDGLIQSGKDTVAGDVRIYPATTARGYLKILAADAAGDYVTTINRASQAAARTYTIPDAGNNASFVMTVGNQTITGNTTLTGNATVSGTTTLATALTGVLKATSGVVSAATGGTDYLRPADMINPGSVVVTSVDGTDGTAVVTITVKNQAATGMRALADVWLSDSTYGPVEAQTANMTIEAGNTAVLIEEVVANDHLRVLLPSNGVGTLTLTGADTGHVVVAVGGVVHSVAFTVTGP